MIAHDFPEKYSMTVISTTRGVSIGFANNHIRNLHVVYSAEEMLCSSEEKNTRRAMFSKFKAMTYDK